MNVKRRRRGMATAAEAAPAPPAHPAGESAPARHSVLLQLLHRLGVGDRLCTLRKKLDKTDAEPKQARLQLTYELARGLLECKGVMADEKASIERDGVKAPEEASIVADAIKKCDGVKPPEEASIVDGAVKNDLGLGLQVDAYDRYGQSYHGMRFGKVGASDGKKKGLYRLKRFAAFVRAAGLKEGDTVVVWVFRLPAAAVEAQGEEGEAEVAAPAPAPAQGRLAFVLLNYDGCKDGAAVEEMVVEEEQALMEVKVLHALLGLRDMQ